MSRPAQQSNHWDYTVEQVPLFANGKATGFFGNVRNDTGECLGVTSERYGLIQNAELLKAAIGALESRGMTDFQQRVIVAGNGQRLYAEFEFRDRQIANAVGDLFGYRLTLQNSFDRSLRASFAMGFLRLACLNGAAALEKEFGVTQKHSTKISVDFVADALDRAVNSAPEALQVYNKMAAKELTNEQGQNILANLEHANLVSGVIREAAELLWLNPRRPEDQPRTVYSLYNAITEHLTHQVEKERYEYASKIGHNVLFSLVNACRKPEKLAKLILPVPQNPAVVMVAQGPVIDVEVVNPAAPAA